MNKSQDKTSEKNKRESNGESGERMAEPGKVPVDHIQWNLP